jgi:hypothetical protein
MTTVTIAIITTSAGIINRYEMHRTVNVRNAKKENIRNSNKILF